MINFTIPLVPVTKKNSNQIILNKQTGKRQIIPSKKYREYEEACGYFVKGKGLKIAEPVTVRCLYFMPTKRRVDLVNLMEATHDILVKYEVLADDNSKIIYSVDGSRVLYDKDNPRTEVEIL